MVDNRRRVNARYLGNPVLNPTFAYRPKMATEVCTGHVHYSESGLGSCKSEMRAEAELPL